MDMELPGMWEFADFTGGETEARLQCEAISFTCTNTDVAVRLEPGRNPFAQPRDRTVCPDCYDMLASIALDHELSRNGD